MDDLFNLLNVAHSCGHDLGVGNETHGHSNIFGGLDTFNSSGQLVDHSMPNIVGGLDHFDASGHLMDHSQANLFGGHNYVDASGHTVATTMPSIGGGIEALQGGQLTGTAQHNIFGGLDMRTPKGLDSQSMHNGNDFITKYFK